MNCEMARTLMLTADPAELAGGPDTDLSRHVAECATCRSRAALLLAAQQALGEELAPVAGASLSPGALVAAAERRRARTRRTRRWTPLAAAAALAGLLLVRGNPGPTGGALSAPPAAEAPYGVTVAAPPGRSVAVLQSHRSDIVVIWFF